MPALEAQQAQLINALGLLLGEQPAALTGELADPKAIPPVPPRVPVGLPSELARRRPDIRRAEAQLHSATADVGVAVAAFYPSFTFSGSVAIQAIQFNELADWGAGPAPSPSARRSPCRSSRAEGSPARWNCARRSSMRRR